jgi:HAD superfamily hydrolase (TIGR01484 family)
MKGRMKPLGELGDEALRRLDGLVFDVDDTLTRGGRLEPVAFDAMHRLASAGVRLWAITGRPLAWAQVFAAQWPIEGAVGENGAGWWSREGAALKRGYFEKEEAVRDAQRATLERILHRVRAELPRVKLASDQPGRAHDLAYDVGESVQLDEPSLNALVALIEDEGARTMISSVHCHAVPGEWSKASGLTRALGATGVEEFQLFSRYAFVGDSPNDSAAFDAFALSVGVANVRDHLDRIERPPAFVTEGDRGSGFAELAQRILGARARA